MPFNTYIDIYRGRIITAGEIAFKYRFFNQCIASWIRYMKVFHVLADVYTPPIKTTGKK